MIDVPKPELRKISEFTTSDGDLFAPVLQIKGSFTLPNIREILQNNLVPHAQELFRKDICRAVFFEPEQVEHCEDDSQALYNETFAAHLGQSGFPLEYFSQRDDKQNPSSCLHTHQRFECTSSMFTENGSIPTVFIEDEEEFHNELIEAAKSFDSSVCREILSASGRTIRERNTQMCTSLQNAHCMGNRAVLQDLYNLHSMVVPHLQGAVHRSSQVGNICIFKGDVVHLADIYSNSSSDESGEVFAQHWRRKPR